MPKTAKRIVLVVAAFIVVVFTIFLFNQTTQIVQSARAVNVVFGNGVMWGLIFTYCMLLTTPLVLWFRLPKRMLPPDTTDSAAYDRFLILGRIFPRRRWLPASSDQLCRPHLQ